MVRSATAFGVWIVMVSMAHGQMAKVGDAEIEAQLRRLIGAQSESWNRGDIEGFMSHYWMSENLTFSSGGKTTRGWQATIEGYKRRYSTPEKMGQLTFDQLEITPLGSDAAFVLGRWQLQRDEPIGGNFSLVFRQMDDRWVIVHDHTSVLKGVEP